MQGNQAQLLQNNQTQPVYEEHQIEFIESNAINNIERLLNEFEAQDRDNGDYIPKYTDYVNHCPLTEGVKASEELDKITIISSPEIECR